MLIVPYSSLVGISSSDVSTMLVCHYGTWVGGWVGWYCGCPCRYTHEPRGFYSQLVLGESFEVLPGSAAGLTMDDGTILPAGNNGELQPWCLTSGTLL